MNNDDPYASNEELLAEGECPLTNCVELAGHGGLHSFQLGKATPICAICGEETDDDFFCYGCGEYVCEVCDPYGRPPFGLHSIEAHLENTEEDD